MKKPDPLYITLPLISLILWAIFSAFAPRTLDTTIPFLFNSPNSVLNAFKTLIFGYGTFFQKFDLFKHIAFSFVKIIFGYSIAVLIAIPLGISIGWSKTVDRLLDPMVELIRPIPPIAWIPLGILWFTATKPDVFPGLFYAGFIIFIGAFFPILLNTIAGVKAVTKLYIEAALTLGAKESDVIRKVIIPGALPSILTGMRIGMGVGWMCLVAAEIVNARYGLGFITVLGMRLYDLGLIISGMILIGIVALLMDRAFRALEEKYLPWRGYA